MRLHAELTGFLSRRERQALDAIRLGGNDFTAQGQLPHGVGRATLNGLVEKGLLECAAASDSRTGYRVTADGWRCMFGRTFEEIKRLPKGVQSKPLGSWAWPRGEGDRRDR